MNGDVTDDDESMGQGAGAPPGASGPPGAGGPPQPGGMLAAMARNQQGPQISAPGPGDQAQAMALVTQAINILKQAGMGLPPGNKLHTDIYNTINRLSRHMGGAADLGAGAGVQKTMLGDQLRQTVKNMMLQRIQQMMGAKGGQGGGPGGPAPMPSTPLPGS